MNLGRYSKVIAYLIGAGLTYATQLWGTGPDAKYLAIAVGVAGALGVHAVTNTPAPAADPMTLVLAHPAAQAPSSAPPAPPAGQALAPGTTITLPGQVVPIPLPDGARLILPGG